MKCKVCGKEAVVALESHHAAFCKNCYFVFFRRQIEKGIKKQKLFDFADRILVALSGGKDSLSLMLELSELGYNVEGLFIDLGITPSSTNARKIVQEFCNLHNLHLNIVDLENEKIAIPDVKKKLKRPICSACGQIKRYYFNKFALDNNFTVLATGHNLDDETARLFSNTLRWDENYLGEQSPVLPFRPGFIKKVKPLWRVSEFETANYAFLKNINYDATPCPYSLGASFTKLKGILNQLERIMPGKKISFYQEFLQTAHPIFARSITAKEQNLEQCPNCGALTSTNSLCGVCRIKEFIRKR